MDQETFDQIKSDILRKHYEDRVHYGCQPGDVANDIKNGIRMVQDILDQVSLTGSKKDVLSEASRKLFELYNEYSRKAEVQSDKIDKFGFTCAVLQRCAKDFEELSLKVADNGSKK